MIYTQILFQQIIMLQYCGIANTLNVTNINTQKLISNKILSQSILTNNIICNGTIQSYSDVGCYLYVTINIPAQGLTYVPSLLMLPLMRSQFVSTMFVPTSPFSFIVILKNGYAIEFYDATNNLTRKYYIGLCL
jgi:hypothetical protein